MTGSSFGMWCRRRICGTDFRMNSSSIEARCSIDSKGGTLATSTVHPCASRLLFTPFQYSIRYFPFSAMDLLSTPMFLVIFSVFEDADADAESDAGTELPPNSSLKRSVKGTIPATGSCSIWSNPEKPWHKTSGYLGVA